MKKFTTLLFAALTDVAVNAQSLVASFAADEASVPYYEMGWDSPSEFDNWTYQSTSSSTWKLGNHSQPFSSIDLTSMS